MIKVSTTGMAVSLKTDLRFPESGQHGHGSRIIHTTLSENDSKDIKRDKLNAFQASHLKVEKIYILASSKIPTLSSQDPSTKM